MARQYADRERDEVEDIVGQWAVQRPELDVSALRVFGHQERAYVRYHASLNSFFDKFGISVAMFDVLVTLRRAAPPHRLTAGQLAKSSLITTGGVTMRIDRLERAGLVVRERDDHDGRIVYSRLTQKGKELVDRVSDSHFARLTRMLQSFSADEQSQLALLLSRLEDSIAEIDLVEDIAEPEHTARA